MNPSGNCTILSHIVINETYVWILYICDCICIKSLVHNRNEKVERVVGFGSVQCGSARANVEALSKGRQWDSGVVASSCVDHEHRPQLRHDFEELVGGRKGSEEARGSLRARVEPREEGLVHWR